MTWQEYQVLMAARAALGEAQALTHPYGLHMRRGTAKCREKREETRERMRKAIAAIDSLAPPGCIHSITWWRIGQLSKDDHHKAAAHTEHLLKQLDLLSAGVSRDGLGGAKMNLQGSARSSGGVQKNRKHFNSGKEADDERQN